MTSLRNAFGPARALFAALVLAPSLSGCVWIAAGGAVAGVTAVRQERSVGNAIDDVRIKSTLESRLAGHSAGLFIHVSGTVVEGRVLLTGTVEEPAARLDASRIAWSVEGVRKVDNDIQVTDATGWYNRPQDLWIATELRATILGDMNIKDVNYTIDVLNGVVYLTGVAQDQAELDRVVAHAKKTSGVARVESYVVLKTDPIRYGYGAPAAKQ